MKALLGLISNEVLLVKFKILGEICHSKFVVHVAMTKGSFKVLHWKCKY